ncbi:TRAP transporter substrate-binding protein [Pseudoalteromonas sp. G4]|uniref:TRAP transporter substrate-binding protein n=1 Tax=Pseudoalteromonas sp. G4 TaxID=2992761 RepID=UPI00237E9FB2|nr:TRAP transporter substrate-binding protein DctP [Pseudoalteromonas sp. G4]MDE3272854.1 TRAP transporter substrate-binding protein DctP [Pseudoalteromonas sp. G4]
MPLSRRNFIHSTTALLASTLVPSSFLSYALSAEKLKAQDITAKQNADHILTFASPYKTEESEYIPHMHQVFKHNIETMSEGKIYVDIKDGGQIGSGTDLMAAVTRGRVDAALISVSNLSRALPVLDVLNIPFWANSNQAFLNLISSTYWQQQVVNKIKVQGVVEVLFHYITGGRTLSTTKHTNKVIKTPNDLRGLVLRVPASKVLKQFYSMTDAHVIEINWAKVASMARSGHIDVIDPGVIGLYAGPDNLRDTISTISHFNTVPDAWVNVVNQKWLSQLPLALRLIVREASHQTFLNQISQLASIEDNCNTAFKNAGCTLFTPDQTTLALWQDQFGQHRHEWRDVKKELMGSVKAFDYLVEASNSPSPYQLS